MFQIIFNYTQPAEDAVDEALTGLKSSLAVKIYGDDLTVLQDKAVQIKNTLSRTPGFTDLTVIRELGQPSLLIDVDRDKIARYGINVADVEAVISAAVGGQAVTQVIQGEKVFDMVVRMQPQFRSSAHEIGGLLVGTPDGKQIPVSQLADIRQGNSASPDRRRTTTSARTSAPNPRAEQKVVVPQSTASIKIEQQTAITATPLNSNERLRGMNGTTRIR